MANSYLNRTQGSATNQKKGTFSFWIKRSKLGSNQRIVTNYNDSNNLAYLRFNSSDQLQHYVLSGGSAIGSIISTRVFRDASAWYNIVMAIDTTQSTAADRIKFYVNGVQLSSFGTNTIPSQNADHPIFASGTHYIGRHSNDADYFDGYISHAAQVDGTALAPTSFGETDSTSGIWKFKSPSGITWGNNGYHLKFENSAALGTDSSGNTNTFTVNGNLKQSLSTPSNIYQSLNPNSTDSGVTLTNGCTTAGFDGSVGNAKGQFAVTKGKWYYECKITAQTNYPMLGIGEINRNQMEKRTGGSYPGGFQDSYGVYGNGNVYANGSNTGSQSFTYTTNDIISVIIDLDSATKTIKWNKNGTQIATTNITNAGDDFAYAPMDYNGGENGVVCNYNFGEGRFGTTDIASAGSNGNGSLFEYDVPSGHYAINTKNINTYG